MNNAVEVTAKVHAVRCLVVIFSPK